MDQLECDGIWIRKRERKTIWVSTQKRICSEQQDQGQNECAQQQDQGQNQCAQQQDQGQNQCAQQLDLGQNQCCDWWPCSWACQAWVWVSNIVCVAWVWVSNMVCVAWVWVSNMVCVAWVWVSNFVCIAWVWVVDQIWSMTIWIERFICSPFTIFNSTKCLQLPEIEPNPIEKEGWVLTFNDEFDNGNLDLNVWRLGPSWGWQFPFGPDTIVECNIPPKQYFSPTNFDFATNNLRLIADIAPQTFQYTDANTGINYGPFTIQHSIGWIETLNFQQQYGFFEIRCRIPNSLAMWPAFWLYCESPNPWPPEIDIFEIYTSNRFCGFNSNYHWRVNEDETESDVKTHKTSNLSSAFHIYGLEWTETEIRWFFDNVLVRVAHNNVETQNLPMKVTINTAVMRDLDKDSCTLGTIQPSDGTYPNFFEIDYVRVYERR